MPLEKDHPFRVGGPVRCSQCGKKCKNKYGYILHARRVHRIKQDEALAMLEGRRPDDDPEDKSYVEAAQAAQERRSIENLLLDLSDLKVKVAALQADEAALTEMINKKLNQLTEDFQQVKAGNLPTSEPDPVPL